MFFTVLLKKAAADSFVNSRCGLILFPLSMLIALTVSNNTFAADAAATPKGLVDPIDIPAFMSIPRPTPTAEIGYGSEPTQMIDLFVPPGDGPFPVAILIHGGCWSKKTAAREQLRHLGADLAQRGIAVWNIGYRRADEAGGGHPGTYQDVAAAIDRLRDEVPRYRFDLSRTVLVGHSAGGHLALWAAGRDRLPPASPLRVAEPFVPRQVIAIAGIGNMKTYSPMVPGFCGPGILENLLGAPTEDRPDVYADTSPSVLRANGARVVMVSGVLDRLVPPYVAHDYARAVRGEVAVQLVNIEGAGHFDPVATGRAWETVRSSIEAALGRGPLSAMPKQCRCPEFADHRGLEPDLQS